VVHSFASNVENYNGSMSRGQSQKTIEYLIKKRDRLEKLVKKIEKV